MFDMGTLYNILHITGAACLIAQAIVFIVLILRWQGRLKRMSDSIECLWAEEKRRISERIEQTPSRRNSGPPFIIRPDPDFKKRLVAAMERGISQNRDAALRPAKESETIGARITTREEYDAMLRNLDVLEKQNNGLPEFKAPPPPPPPKGNESF